MARLKSHGTELLRVSKERTFQVGQHLFYKDGTDAGETLTTWERITRAYMSDGKILEKHDVRFVPDSIDRNGRFYSYGWKLWGKVKPGVDPRTVVEKAKLAIAEGRSKYTIESSSGPTPILLSQKRIMRAIESGEMIGFCKACGAEAEPVEPDARNYRCESCGQHEVYGAEECLIGL